MTEFTHTCPGKPSIAKTLAFLALVLLIAFIVCSELDGALATHHLEGDNFNASSIAVINGTLTDGLLNATYLIDGDWYNITEENSAPGLDVRFNFTGLGVNQSSGCIDIYHTYKGHSQHEIKIEVWNFTSSTWHIVGNILFNETSGWECSGLGPVVDHLFNDGELWARFYHEGIGHVAHELQIDDINLNVYYPSACPPPSDTYSCAVVDNYINETRVAGKHRVVRNTTFNAMELDYYSFENFTDYTEVDIPGDLITITPRKIEWNSQTRLDDTRAYKDFGAGYFGDFSIDFEMEYTDVEAGDDSAAMINTPFAISNSNGDWDAIWASRSVLIYVDQDGAVDDRVRYHIFSRSGGAIIGSDVDVFRNIAKYYCRMSRTGASLNCKFYSDPDRTALVFQLTCVTHGFSLRYTQIAVSRNDPVDGSDHSTGYIQYLTTGKGYDDQGHFYTTDILAGIDYTGLALLLNSTIPGGDSITLEISQDNSSWILNDWEPIFGGYESIDLRDLEFNTMYFRFNFTDGEADSTPRLHQFILYHGAPRACIDGVAKPDYAPYIALSIILLLIGLMIGWGVRRWR